ncbi:PAS domain S-box [Bernardetia litoralis DSM 6794]|uniref:histidine kinase n=1 Tax=Bernardetia litoralis (strain ATCC 23117 / DSM 6794 / NBRC 15988 / NCIMB 1366 / Fx l1 / Sio-4) TaxID=880071 RepID=I4ALL7_BERLS|nr:7TM diverse intracellular signaling domain-containing protein [Bernardetia litoralis]AFM04852.1 PAS domain S-box [Bernardetia litoralis DSM 6794]
MSKVILFLYFYLLFNLSFGQDKIVTIEHSTDLVQIGKKLSFFEDQTGSLSFNQIRQLDKEGKFNLHTKGIFARQASASTFWFRFQTQNLSDREIWLNINTTYLWEIDFYSPNSIGNYSKPLKTGVLRTRQEKLYPSNTFWLPLQKEKDNSIKTFYLKVKSGRSLEVPLLVGSLQALEKEKDKGDFMTAGFIGALIIMFLYNSFLFFATRKKLYLLYICYLFGITFSVTFANNYSFWVEFFGKDDFYTWIHIHIAFWITPVQIVVALITIFYLDLKQKNKFAYYFLISIIAIIFIIGCLNLFVPLQKIQFIHQFFLALNAITNLIISYWITFGRKKNGLFYALGWTSLVISVLIYLATINGIIPYFIYTRNAIYFGVILEIWFFSLALSDHIRSLRKENKRVIQNLLLKAEKEIEMRNQIIKNQKQLEEANTNNLKLAIANQERMVLRNIIDNLPVFIAMLDTNGNYIVANKMYEDSFFLPVSHIEGNHYLKVLPKNIADIHTPYLKQVNEGNPVEFADPLSLPNGKIIHSYGKYFPVFDENKKTKYITVFITNVSDLKDKEVELQRLNDTKDKLFSIISHDLRSPFAQLKGILDLFEKGGISENELKYFLPEIVKNVNYTSDLLNNLVYWAKTQMSGLHADPEEFNIYKLVANKQNLFDKEIKGKDLSFTNQVALETIVYADKNMIDLVIRNLVANAIKFCRKKDTILIKSEETANGFLIIRVVDTGIGISPKNKAKIFNEANFTTLGTHKEKGTGIGLKLCKEFIEGNGGKIWIDSEEEKGTIFSFSLPTQTR